MLAENLAGYCGMYCSACAIHTGEIRAAVLRLKEIIDLYELTRLTQVLGGIEDFPQFLKVLDGLEIMFGKCEGCKKDGGWPNCPMRECCVERNLKSCYECDKVPCPDLLNFQKKHFLIPAPHYAENVINNEECST